VNPAGLEQEAGGFRWWDAFLTDPSQPTDKGTGLPDALLGRTLAGKYRLELLLGEGGMGAVYRARHIALEKTIAIKVMRREFAADPVFAARFEREAKAAYHLDHVNSIRIHDFGREDDGLLYIAMEFLDGRDLLSVLNDEAPLTSARTVDFLSQVLSALAVAHERGIIHRDLKPENIMILRRMGEDERERELVKVCDFGIAQVAEATGAEDVSAGRPKKGKLTIPGLVMGTPEYMSPEQGRGEMLDARADLYSVGVILYFMLCGRTPFEAPTSLGIVVKHQNEEPLRPSAIWSAADPRLEEVCAKAMRKRPADRYASAREMRVALHAAVGVAAIVGSAPHALDAAPLGNLTDTRAGARLPSSVTTLALSVNDPGRPTAALPALSSKDVAQATSTASGATSLAGSVTPSLKRKAGRALGAALGLALLGGGARYGIRARASVGSEAKASDMANVVQEPPSLRSADVPLASAAPTSVEALVVAPIASIPLARHRRRPDPGPSSLVSEDPPLARESAAPPASGASPAPLPITGPRGPPIEAPPPVPSSPPATAEASATPVSAPFESSTVRVVAGSATDLGGGARPSDVNGVVRAAMGTITACYRASATASSPEGSWTLRIATDDTGHVEDARLDGPLPGPVRTCISNAFRGATIHVDTGPGSAKVQLRFTLR
jgi:serine/threonine protein kinase